MAIVMLIIRQHHETPMLPAACLSALLCPLLVWPFAAPIDVSMPDLLKLFLFGTTQFGLGLVFLTVGGQMVSATENALINTLETSLAVAWVWVCFSETPIRRQLRGRHDRHGGSGGAYLVRRATVRRQVVARSSGSRIPVSALRKSPAN
jgi:drug/metabolite transporter (DMT)-like permease